jgi:hypothetical protein
MPDDPKPSLDPDDARERLDQVDEKIDEVKRHLGDETDPDEERPLYADSGATPEEDDQTITPPG